jgi:hypothetical protein
MSALSVLSKGEVMSDPSLHEEDDMGTTDVSPAGDTLVDEGEMENNDGGKGEVDESGTAQPEINTSSELMSPTDGDSTKSSANTDAPMSASSNAPTEKKDNLTGVDDSYVTETDKETKETKSDEGNTTKNPEENNNIPKEMSKGSGESEQSGHVGESEPQIGEGEDSSASPSGKDTAFWVPGDDLLGLKDIVSTVGKNSGGVDAQENIVKDPSTGALVKKPTTPNHAIPNMRQYVRTNGVPGAPTVNGIGGPTQPVDISDLDGLMGMDTKNDKALNISLNFNF